MWVNHIQSRKDESQAHYEHNFQRPHQQQPEPGETYSLSEGHDREEQQDLRNHIHAISQHTGNRDELARHRHPLDESDILDQGSGAAQPRKGKHIIRNQAAHREDRVIRNLILIDPGEHKPQHTHHYERIQKGPKHAQ